MNTFFHSFTEGMFHIFCLDAIDHILFLLALVARFDFTKLKYVFWMVTAFTIGHAITFMLAALGKFYDVRSMAEMAIPATIAITAIYNMFSNHKWGRSFSVSFIAYVLALFFGSIHGLAIGSMLRMKLINGHFITQLVGYNLGIEFAQIAVVLLGANCRHEPSCSSYSIEAFKEWGVFKAFMLSINRITSCRPGGKSGYDPVPKNTKK